MCIPLLSSFFTKTVSRFRFELEVKRTLEQVVTRDLTTKQSSNYSEPTEKYENDHSYFSSKIILTYYHCLKP